MNDATEHGICANCQKPLSGAFCSHCGQNSRKIRVSFASLIADFFGEFFSWDSRLLRSISPLFIKPGYLTVAFKEGKRVRFLSPIKLYLILSLLFFFILTFFSQTIPIQKPSIVPQEVYESMANPELPATLRIDLANFASQLQENVIKKQLTELTTDENPSDQTAKSRTRASLEKTLSRLKSQKTKWIKAINDGSPLDKPGKVTIRTTISEGNPFGAWLNEKVQERQASFNQMDEVTIYKLFISTLLKVTPKVFFILLPVFAALMKMAYRKRHFLYIDHLIFALHLHSYLFGLGLIVLLASALFPDPAIVVIAFLLLSFLALRYFLLALKQVYAQDWAKTALKCGIVLIFYVPSLFVGVSLAAIWSIFSV